MVAFNTHSMDFFLRLHVKIFVRFLIKSCWLKIYFQVLYAELGTKQKMNLRSSNGYWGYCLHTCALTDVYEIICSYTVMMMCCISWFDMNLCWVYVCVVKITEEPELPTDKTQNTEHNTTQHNSTQHNTTQHNTTQHNIAQQIHLKSANTTHHHHSLWTDYLLYIGQSKSIQTITSITITPPQIHFLLLAELCIKHLEINF